MKEITSSLKHDNLFILHREELDMDDIKVREIALNFPENFVRFIIWFILQIKNVVTKKIYKMSFIVIPDTEKTRTITFY